MWRTAYSAIVVATPLRRPQQADSGRRAFTGARARGGDRAAEGFCPELEHQGRRGGCRRGRGKQNSRCRLINDSKTHDQKPTVVHAAGCCGSSLLFRCCLIVSPATRPPPPPTPAATFFTFLFFRSPPFFSCKRLLLLLLLLLAATELILPCIAALLRTFATTAVDCQAAGGRPICFRTSPPRQPLGAPQPPRPRPAAI